MVDIKIEETTRPIVAEALRAIEADGRFTADDVYTAAKNKASPLHSFFEWDKTKAAYKYNIEVARSLIRTVRITKRDAEPTVARPVPVYVRDPDCKPDEQGYVALRTIVVNSPSAYTIMLNEIERVTAALARAQGIAGEIGFLDDVNELIERVVELKDNVNAKGALIDA